MKKLRSVLAAMALTGLAAPALAQDNAISPVLAAYLEISGGALFAFDGSGSSDAIGIFNAAARGNVPLRGTWNLQLDVQTLTGFESGFSETAVAAYAHLYSRRDSHAVGLFGGALYVGVFAPTVGVEAVKFNERVTLVGQLLYAYYNAGGPFGINSVQVRGGASYYVSDNTAIYAEALETYSWAGPETVNSLTGILGVRHRLMNLPVTAFAQARLDYLYDPGAMSSFTIGSAVVGLSINIGGGSNLRETDAAVPMRVRWVPVL